MRSPRRDDARCGTIGCTRTAATRFSFDAPSFSETGFAASAHFRRRSLTSGVRRQPLGTVGAYLVSLLLYKIREKINVIGGWLPSLTFALVSDTMNPTEKLFVLGAGSMNPTEMLFVLGAGFILFALGRFLPRLSTFVLGPGCFVVAAVFFVKYKALFFPFPSDGSAAGLFVPFLMWGLLLILCMCGVVLISTGLKYLAQQASRSVQSDAILTKHHHVMSHLCPNCQRSVYSSSLKHCGYCGAELPADLFAETF